MKKTWIATLAAAFGALTVAHSAHAAIEVIGNEYGRECYIAAQVLSRDQGNGPRKISDGTGIVICTQAIAEGQMSGRDEAATYNNRGLIFFVQGTYQSALGDFERGLKFGDSLAELHVNRGSVLIMLRRWQESLDELNKGIALNSGEIEKAYYNRAIANEELGNIREAYDDYKKASELKPDWDMPLKEMARFNVNHTLQK